jgi:ParB/RepB/Spo0J family partition protein
MTKGKKQTAEELLRRYSRETVGLEAASASRQSSATKSDPLLDGLRRNLNRVVMVPLDLLVIEENVRQAVDDQSPEFASLVDSVRENGIRQNIIVDLQDADEAHYRLVVVAGQRRVLAGKQAGLRQVAALILRMGGRSERLLEGLAENLLREDLHCLDQAEAYAALIEEGWTQEQIAEKFDRRQRTILKFLRLARYPQKARDFIRANRELFTTSLLLNHFVARNWKSENELLRSLREAAGQRSTSARPSRARVTPSQQRLIRSVSRYNGLSCQVSGADEAGKITITYKSKTALEKIIRLFEED